MNTNKMGHALIFNNRQFYKVRGNKKEPKGFREGTEYDEKRLEEVFKELNFEVKVETDATGQVGK